MSELKKIVRAFMAADDRAEAWVAREMGISRSALNGWWTRGRTSAPSSELLRAMARVTRTPYRSVLDAALLDFGYLPEEGQAHGNPPAKKSLSVVPDPPEDPETSYAGPDPFASGVPLAADAPGVQSEGQAVRDGQDKEAEGDQTDPDAE